MIRSLVALALAAAPAAAQPTLEARFGAGLAHGTGAPTGSSTGPLLVAGAAARLEGGVRIVLEGTYFGVSDESPRTSDLRWTGSDFVTVRRPRIFETLGVLAAVEVSRGRTFLRPGVGLGRHGFASYRVGAQTVETAEVSHEWSPALGLAGGRELGGPLGLSMEAAVQWSQGEDSSSGRTLFSLRLVSRLSP